MIIILQIFYKVDKQKLKYGLKSGKLWVNGGIDSKMKRYITKEDLAQLTDAQKMHLNEMWYPQNMILPLPTYVPMRKQKNTSKSNLL